MKALRASQPFSLIELLVVIAVMSVLTALLLPALGNAKRAAHSIRCLNDQKTVSTAMQYYSQDNTDYLVPHYQPGPYVATHQTGWWFYFLLDGDYSYLGVTVSGGDYIKMETAKQIMLDMPPARSRNFPSYSGTGYGYFKGGYNAPRKIHMIAKPSRSILLGDSATTIDYTYYNVNWRSAYCYSWQAFHYRHPGLTANVSFPDGHGAGIRPDAQNEPDYWSLWADMP